MKPSGPILLFPTDLEPEERAAQSLQLNPFDQLSGINLPGVHPERIAVRQLALIAWRSKLDEPPVARPFLRRYSVDVACESGLLVPAACCAEVSWFISVNPVMIAVIKRPARSGFFLFCKRLPAQIRSASEILARTLAMPNRSTAFILSMPLVRSFRPSDLLGPCQLLGSGAPDRAAERRHKRDGSRDNNCRGDDGEQCR